MKIKIFFENQDLALNSESTQWIFTNKNNPQNAKIITNLEQYNFSYRIFQQMLFQHSRHVPFFITRACIFLKIKMTMNSE